MPRTILTLEVWHPAEQTEEDVAAIMNIGLDEIRKDWQGPDYHINKFVPINQNQWDLPTSIVHVPTNFDKTRFVLADDSDDRGAVIEQKGQVDFEGAAHDNAVVLNLDGFGLKTMDAGFGGVVLLEYWARTVRLLVWDNINEEDPSHIICLEGARESRRQVVEE